MRTLLALFVLVAGCKGQESTAPPITSSSPTSSVPPSASSTPASSGAAQPVGGARTFGFDSDAPGSPPAGFASGKTGDGREGKWVVKAEPGAPSGPNVVAQTDADTTDYRFPVLFADQPIAGDLELSVRCKPISGKVDQACGLVFRLRDANNYYITRANALENNVRLYYVKDGKRQQIASWSGTVTSGAWHDYRVVSAGDHFEVYWDGAKVIDQHDKTFTEAGKVGLWTKADSVTYFDDLKVIPR